MEFNTFNHIKMEGGPMGGWPAPPTTPPGHSDKKVNPFMQWAIFNSVQGVLFAPGQPANTPPPDIQGRILTARMLTKMMWILQLCDTPLTCYYLFVLFCPLYFVPHFSFHFIHNFCVWFNMYLLGGNSGAQTPKPDQDHSRPSSVNPAVVTSEAGNRQGVTYSANTAGHYNGHTLHSMLPVDPNLHHPHNQQHHHTQQHPHQQQQQQAGDIMASHAQNNDTAFPGASHQRQNYPGQQPGQMQQHQLHLSNKVNGDKAQNNLPTKHKLYTEENGQVNNLRPPCALFAMGFFLSRL